MLAAVVAAWALSYVTYRVDSWRGRLVLSVVHGGGPVDLSRGESVTELWDDWLGGVTWSVERWGLEAHRAGPIHLDHFVERPYTVTLVAVPYWQLTLLAPHRPPRSRSCAF